MRSLLVASLALYGATGYCQSAPPNEEDTLKYIEGYLRGCTNVSSVQRADVAFRVKVDTGPMSILYEFNVADLKTADGGSDVLIVECVIGGCIKEYGDIQSHWVRLNDQSSWMISCGSQSGSVTRAINYYHRHFGNSEISFPEN